MKMKLPACLFAFIALFAVAVGSAQAMWGIAKGGTWPKNWPEQLERLRKQSYTVNGGLTWYPTSYEIPFSNREDFESAWPYLLKVKTEGAPVILVSSSAKRAFISHNSEPGISKPGVIINYPHSRAVLLAREFTFPADPAKLADAMPPDPFKSNGPITAKKIRDRWYQTTYLELVVDGEIVDLNRIPLPASTPIVDERFEPVDAAENVDQSR